MQLLSIIFRSIQSHRRRRTPSRGLAAVSVDLEIRCLLAAKVIVAPASYEFRDMGFDAATQEVGIVGYDGTGTVGVTKIAKLFELNGTQDGFTAQTLVGLGNPTYVNGISSDGYRIAGVSKSSDSIDVGEGTTWLRSNASNPVGIGYASWTAKTSVAIGAWHDGVVGDSGGLATSIKWTRETGVIDLGGHFGFVGQSNDISSDGSIAVGFASHEVFDGAAYYWDSTGIHRLEDPYSVQSVAYCISPDGDAIGGFVSEDKIDRGYVYAAYWDANRNLVPILDSHGVRVEGAVRDISNHGYAVGTTSDNRGFIWHPSFDGVHSQFTGAQYFDDWLQAVSGTTLPFASQGVEAIAEDPVDGQLLFALSAYEAAGASAFVQVDVAGINDAVVVTSAVHQGKLPPNVVSVGIATLEVGLRGSATFDVTKLGRASLFIGDERNTASGKISSIKIKDMDGDGFKDAIISLKSNGTLRSDTSRLKITGRLTDGTTLDGSRTVTSTTQSVNAYWQATTGAQWKSMLSAYTRGLKKTWW